VARDISAHEAGASGDGDFHGVPPFQAAHKYTMGR
jgi:hypothetical protein